MRMFRRVPDRLRHLGVEKAELSVPVHLHPNREPWHGRREARSRAKSRPRLQPKRFPFWGWDRRTISAAPFKNLGMRRSE
jgi:hypothetical protein